jgi:hypothetical protein
LRGAAAELFDVEGGHEARKNLTQRARRAQRTSGGRGCSQGPETGFNPAAIPPSGRDDERQWCGDHMVGEVLGER